MVEAYQTLLRNRHFVMLVDQEESYKTLYIDYIGGPDLIHQVAGWVLHHGGLISRLSQSYYLLYSCHFIPIARLNELRN